MALEPEIVEEETESSMTTMINLIPDSHIRAALYNRHRAWVDYEEKGQRTFFERQEFLLQLAQNIPFTKKNQAYINFITKLLKASSDAFKDWMAADAIPELSAQVDELQADLTFLVEHIKKDVPKEYAEPLLEAWKLERAQR